MQFAVAVFPTERIQPPDELGRMAEDRGFEALLFPEHTHIPVSRQSPYPAGGELPDEYSRTYDPFVATSFAAAGTERLRVGTAICLVIERDPIVTAKEVASVDRLSGGRFLFGVGAGWNVEEMANHGTAAEGRFGLLRERVEAIRAIWTEDEASYHGRYVDFDPIWCWPKPAQPGGPPVLVGGNGPRVLERVVAFGDEWFPNRVASDDQMIAQCEALTRLAGEAGRTRVPVTLAGMPRDPARIAAFEQAGVHRAVFWLPAGGREAVEGAMDKVAAAAEEYRRGGS